jgi:hypothetical protein
VVLPRVVGLVVEAETVMLLRLSLPLLLPVLLPHRLRQVLLLLLLLLCPPQLEQ